MSAPIELVLTCEHASSAIPPRYRRQFADASERLRSHAGHDIGAMTIARALGDAFETPVLATRTSRLLVDVNRSAHHPRVFGREVRDLPREERVEILAAWHTPHRRAVHDRVAAAIAEKGRVLHVAVHTFTPVLDGRDRRTDIGLLYDPSRRWETELCRAWQRDLRARLPGFRIRRNHPYRGASDGLTRTLRSSFADAAYAGFELEVSQALAAAPGRSRRHWINALVASLNDLCER